MGSACLGLTSQYVLRSCVGCMCVVGVGVSEIKTIVEHCGSTKFMPTGLLGRSGNSSGSRLFIIIACMLGRRPNKRSTHKIQQSKSSNQAQDNTGVRQY